MKRPFLTCKFNEGNNMWKTKIASFAFAVLIILSGDSYSQESEIKGRLMSGATPIANAEIGLYMGNGKKPLGNTTSDKDGKFRFKWNYAQIDAEIMPNGNVSIKKQRTGINKWKITIIEGGQTSFIKTYWFLLGPIFGFIVGAFYNIIKHSCSRLWNRRSFRKNEFGPLQKRLAKLFCKIHTHVENKKFDRLVVDECDKKAYKLLSEIEDTVKANTDSRNYDRASWSKLKTHLDDFSFLHEFLSDKGRKHQEVLGLHFYQKERAKKEYPIEESHFDSIETSLGNLLTYRNNK